MSPIDLIKKLALSFSLSWNKRTGANSTQAKIKTKNNIGDVAGRDIHKTYVTTPAPTPEEAPFIYLDASFGGNGVQLRLAACRTHNLSDQFVFLERIEILGRTINFNDSVIKAGATLSHTGIDDLSYPETDEERYLEIFFKAKNGRQFVGQQKLQYGSRQDGKFNIIGLGKPQIEAI